MSLKLEDVKIKDVVEIKNPDIEEQGEMTNETTVRIIEGCNYQGEVTKVDDGLIYVGFISELGWVTQVFKPEELKGVD